MWSTSRCASLSLLLLSAVRAAALPCTYETWDWDTVQKKAVNPRRVVKPREALTTEEKDPIEPCTVCEEDQAEVRVHGLPPFKVCRAVKGRITRAVSRARKAGFTITSVVGYRVGKSKGPKDTQGRRTQFSNHSFGTALDFNAASNGLYDSCPRLGPSCRLVRGGEYHADAPLSVTRGSPLYRAMVAEGFKWGGEIEGRQKDFMHFSLSGK